MKTIWRLQEDGKVVTYSASFWYREGMSKTHFEALAMALKAVSPAERLSSGEGHQWRADVEQIADVCVRFNPNFDRARFLAACGIEAK